MRLRYLCLPHYGVLKDLRVQFDRELIFRESGELRREGDLHFVVGLNGTGKSSLLRAIYETFRWLEGVNDKSIDPRLPFPFPVTLIYDLPATQQVNYARSCVFHHPGGSVSGGYFFNAMSSLNEAEHGDWDGWIEWLNQHAAADSAQQISGLIRSDKLQGNNQVAASLPRPLLVYTSGSMAIWNRVREPELPDEDLAVTSESSSGDYYDERPRGWDIHREVGSVEVEISEDEREALKKYLDPKSHEAESRCRLLDPLDLRLAAVAIGLTVAAGEVTKLQSEPLRENWRAELLAQVEAQRQGKRPDQKTSRTLLNELDWWFPTHLSIEYRSSSAKLNPEWHAQLLVLAALSCEVLHQPLNRRQLIINLAKPPRIIAEELKVVFAGAKRDIPVEVKEVIDRVDGSSSGAQAVLRTLCTEQPSRYTTETEPEFARWPVFDRLHAWRQARLIDNVSVTIKRVTQMKASDGELDDVVVTWDDLSDGEQMLLGRMSLLMLLSKQNGSLLLLDEPETHFNDSWKREIIDIVDDNILKTTAAHVVVSTHTSIALTDAFASEIIRLVRSSGNSILKPVKIPTFGAAPSRIMTHVFDMPASIGSRAEQALRAYMARQWNRNEVGELEALLANIGNGWPMAQLQRILDSLSDVAQNP